MTERTIRRGVEADIAGWSALRAKLWPEENAARHAADVRHILANPGRMVGFLAVGASGDAQGFAEATLRGDYVNGTESSPVGFLEGWYVEPGLRGRGIGRALVAAVEAWTRACGCGELASDALLDNAASHAAHQACGFEETERVVYFRKRVD